MELWGLEFKRIIKAGGKYLGIINIEKIENMKMDYMVYIWYVYIEKRNG